MGDRITITAEELLAEVLADLPAPFDKRLDVTARILAERAGITDDAARNKLSALEKAGRLVGRTLTVDNHPRMVWRAKALEA